MLPTPRKSKLPYAPRAYRRHEVDAVSSDLGRVLDLSVGGARIACRRRPPIRVGSIVPISLRHPDGTIELRAQVVWVERRGVWRWELGLRLASSAAPIRRALEVLLGERPAGEESGGKSPGQKPVNVALCLPNYYVTLGVKPGSSLQQIRAAYHREARKYHPDTNQSPDASAQFIKIKEAYEVLRRAVYATADGPQTSV